MVAAKNAAAAAPPSYFLEEDFEGTGYQLGGWTESGTGTLDEDYTTTVLEGSQSFHVNKTSETGAVVITFTAADDVWVYFKFRPISIPAAQSAIICILNSSNTVIWEADITSTGLLRLASGNTVTAMTANTTYHVWGHYVKGTGSDGIQNGAFSTTGIRPSSGNEFRGVTNNAATTQANKLRITSSTSTTLNFIIDDIKMATSTIGNNP